MQESILRRILITVALCGVTSAQYFRGHPPPPFYSPLSPYHFTPSDGIGPAPLVAMRHDLPYPGMMESAASSPFRGQGQGQGYGYAYTHGGGPVGYYEASPQPQPYARGHSNGIYHNPGHHGYREASPQYYEQGAYGQGPSFESSPSYGHSPSYPSSYPHASPYPVHKPKLIQPTIHREHVHVHNIYKVSPPHQEIFRHNIHHHNVKKEHIHQPVYHKTEKHVHTNSDSHKNKYHVKEYNKHKAPSTQETHKWLQPIYAESSAGWGKTIAAAPISAADAY